MTIGRRAEVRSRGRRAAAALLLVLLLIPETALAVWRGAAHGCECRHDSCPVRPAEAVPPPGCHDTGGHPAPPADTGPPRSLQAACSCGLPHAPAAPHRESRAVFEAAYLAFSLPPSGFLALRPGSAPASHLTVPESPPPRSPVPA
jgi:hypothetical protein